MRWHILVAKSLLVMALGAVASLAAAPVSPAALPAAAKLPPQRELPDPLIMRDGTRIATAAQWHKQRVPELQTLFQHYMYGYFPPPAKISAKVQRVDPKALGGKATLKEITISFGPEGTPPIHLLLVVPNQRSKPAPVFVGMNFCGNHALVQDPAVRLPTAWIYPNYAGVKNNTATEAGRGSQIDVWNLEQSIDRGYAVATFYNGDIDPDRRDAREGIQSHLRPKDAPASPHDWATIAAWAWGIQRVVDYLVSDPDLDAARIIVVGHSRLGKTALLAGAFDQRIAVIIPHQAGCGGTAPSRGTVGEQVRQITKNFPHWFTPTFKEFSECVERLPFDQHCLVALCAPRPVLLSNAVEDTWANPAGQFQMLLAADAVYRLLGVEGVKVKTMPAVGQLVDSRLGYFIRAGKHSMNREDWKVFLDFADKHLGK